MKKHTSTVAALAPFWKKSLEKRSIDAYKKEIEIFENDIHTIQTLNRINVFLSLFHPHYLANNLNYWLQKRKVLHRFWRFSKKLRDVQIGYENNCVSQTEWEECLSGYLRLTLESPEKVMRIITAREVLKYI